MQEKRIFPQIQISFVIGAIFGKNVKLRSNIMKSIHQSLQNKSTNLEVRPPKTKKSGMIIII